MTEIIPKVLAYSALFLLSWIWLYGAARLVTSAVCRTIKENDL